MQMFKKTPNQMANLGIFLKNLRQELGLSMHEAARRSGLSPSYISKIESGNVFKSITVWAIVKFSKIYGIPVNNLLEKAGFLEKQDELPGLSIYLRLKYDVPFQAVKDMEIAWEIIKKKYKNVPHLRLASRDSSQKLG